MTVERWGGETAAGGGGGGGGAELLFTLRAEGGGKPLGPRTLSLEQAGRNLGIPDGRHACAVLSNGWAGTAAAAAGPAVVMVVVGGEGTVSGLALRANATLVLACPAGAAGERRSNTV